MFVSKNSKDATIFGKIFVERLSHSNSTTFFKPPYNNANEETSRVVLDARRVISNIDQSFENRPIELVVVQLT